MNNALSIDPAERQVLVNLGNRFVVFGPEGRLPEPLRFDPNDSEVLPRVADESEVAEARIAETLQVAGMTRRAIDPERASQADFELIDTDGNRVLVDVKVRESDPKLRDLRLGTEQLNLSRPEGQHLEIWFFNIERLSLTVMRQDASFLRIDRLVPLNVWEKTSEGVFERQRVIEEVNDWVRRIELLYVDVKEWLNSRTDFEFEQTRTIIMSEELMQQFAVTDRELSVLDILHEDQVIASFVPRGLWLVGSWGRIDIITKDKTSILIAMKKLEKFEWLLALHDDRRRRIPFDKAALLELMSGQ